MSDTDRLVIFDGVCGLCHAFVKFIIRYDRRRLFMFASAQSDYAQALLIKFNMPVDQYETFLYVEDGIPHGKSSAFFRIMRLLPLPVKLLSIFSIFPKFLLDGIYDRIAQNRYTLWGRREECELTETENRDRFT